MPSGLLGNLMLSSGLSGLLQFVVHTNSCSHKFFLFFFLLFYFIFYFKIIGNKYSLNECKTSNAMINLCQFGKVFVTCQGFPDE